MSQASPPSLQMRFQLARPGFTLDVDFQLPGEGISVLFGHSGSGKTTLLRLLAGLEHAPGGQLRLGETVWQDEARRLFLPPHRRPVGFVFQEASLFPHLSVADNMRYGQKRSQPAGKGFELERIADLLGIRPLLTRRPDTLSGGEAQRVAIARALLCSPQILLMDEPLAALDWRRKQEILPYLERLHQELAIPVVYVSHAPDEVARLADHLVLLEAGKIVASGPLNQVLSRLDLPAAFADDAGVVLTARIVGHEADDLTRLAIPGGEIYVSSRNEAIGTALRCRVHARDVSLALQPASDSSILNTVAATVVDLATTDTPGHVMVRLDMGNEGGKAGENSGGSAPNNHPLLARITRRSAERLGIRPGLPLYAQIKAVALLG